jgi:hypothetical protein
MSIERTNTYGGSQMTFRFPSEESVLLLKLPTEGPKVQSYYQYAQSCAGRSDGDYSVAGSSNFNSTEQSIHSFQESTQEFSACGSNVPSIPTETNVSYQITSSSEQEATANIIVSGDVPVVRTQSPRPQSLIACPGSSVIPVNGRFSTSSSSIRRSSALKRAGSIRRANSIKNIKSINRSPSIKSEDVSLYEKASLKRSRAIKYNVGWLTRLEQLGINLKNKFKNWRFISLKRAFRFNRKSMRRGHKKNDISLPLEREGAESISELRMATDDLNNARLQYNGSQLPVTPRYRTAPIVSDSCSFEQPRVPPPLPKHRIPSSQSMKRHIDEENKQLKKSFNGYNSVLLAPMDQQQVHVQEEPKYPSKPISIYDNEPDEEVEVDDDEDEDEDEYEDEEDEVEEETARQEFILREYWARYLRKAVADRIESKLEMHRFSQIPTPHTYNYYAEDIISSYSVSEFEMDNDTVSCSSTSISSAESDGLSSDVTESSSAYCSSYSRATIAPSADIMRYQQEYIDRIRNAANIKRSSTLPTTIFRQARLDTVKPQLTHSRLFSVVP